MVPLIFLKRVVRNSSGPGVPSSCTAAVKAYLLKCLLVPDEELALPGLRLELVQGPGEESHGEQGVVVILVDQLR